MVNLAILVGNSNYDSLTNLPCCSDDVTAMNELLEATERYSHIEVIENDNSDSLKTRIRANMNKHPSIDEIFFYFTRHGCQQDDEFYYCATGFDPKHPNTTGISTSELHELLRMAGANIVVKVVDACNSGTVLVKSGQGFVTDREHRFTNFIQMSSCLDSQNSLAGNPLSLFTAKFRESALRKTEGVVHYTDIIYSLRDEFIGNDTQTPFFVSQGTGREQFVDDAKRLYSLRDALSLAEQSLLEVGSSGSQIESALVTLPDLLASIESRSATSEKINFFVDGLFDSLRERISDDEFSDYFDLDVVEHSGFEELSTEGFIIQVLSKESRSDAFVKTERKDNSVVGSWTSLLIGAARGDQGYRDTYDLRLNCRMKRAQLKLMMTPKYHSLKMLTLVVTCAPSLEHCYIFEMVSEHSLKDFGEYDAEGEGIVRRWYKYDWDNTPDDVAIGMVTKLKEAVRSHLERTQQRLIRANT